MDVDRTLTVNLSDTRVEGEATPSRMSGISMIDNGGRAGRG
jgi:hypothetical protein